MKEINPYKLKVGDIYTRSGFSFNHLIIKIDGEQIYSNKYDKKTHKFVGKDYNGINIHEKYFLVKRKDVKSNKPEWF